jgi:hypothetical protein
MTPNLSEADGPVGDPWSGAKLRAGKRSEEKRRMTVEELAAMSLESLLYYVLVGEGRIAKEAEGQP